MSKPKKIKAIEQAPVKRNFLHLGLIKSNKKSGAHAVRKKKVVAGWRDEYDAHWKDK